MNITHREENTMRRFAVVDSPKNGLSGDQFETICSSAKEAIDKAIDEWDYLTSNEKEKRSITAVEYLPPEWAEEEMDMECVGDFVNVFWCSDDGGFLNFTKSEIHKILDELDGDDPLYISATNGTTLFEHIASCSDYEPKNESLWDDIDNMMEKWIEN